MAAAIAATATIPVYLCDRNAEKWADGDRACQLKLASGVQRLLFEESFSVSHFRTGYGQFDGEWFFGTYLMAGIGFSQMAMEHPELRDQENRLTIQCIERMLTPEVRAADKASWDEDPIDGIDGKNDHAAYLGYLNFLLGIHRLATGDNTYAALNDRITAALIRHLKASPISLLETYPREVYPVDNCFVIGSIGLHQRVTGQDHREVLERWSDQARAHTIDRATHLLVQAVDERNSSRTDAPRGSGTALGLLALYYADPHLAGEMYQGLKTHLAGTCLGFGVVREYPGTASGRGDIDSGPILFGYGFSATGFSIGSARRFGDTTFFKQLLANANLWGAPIDRGNRREYVTGGPLGNAILFAMLTTPRALQADKTGGNR